MNKFTLGLALVACSAAAAEIEAADYGYSHSAPNYGSSSSSHAYASPSYASSSSSYGSVPNYGSSSSHSHSSPSYGHSYRPAPVAPSYGGSHHHGYGGNPWGVATTTKSGWWSGSQQYSPPQIPYVPYEGINAPIFAQCDMVPSTITLQTNDLQLEFAQLPHQPISVKGTWTSATSNGVSGLNYSFAIREYGNTGRAGGTGTCLEAQMGKVFNPLNEIDKYGRSNPYQDPDRGTIATQDGSQSADVFYQNYLLANLAGPESIMGMGVQMTYTDTNTPADPVVVGCCPITTAPAPATYSPYATASTYPYYAGGHSHGGYGSGHYDQGYGAQSHGHGQSYGGHSHGGHY